jgi:hypothetical protein
MSSPTDSRSAPCVRPQGIKANSPKLQCGTAEEAAEKGEKADPSGLKPLVMTKMKDL